MTEEVDTDTTPVDPVTDKVDSDSPTSETAAEPETESPATPVDPNSPIQNGGFRNRR